MLEYIVRVANTSKALVKKTKDMLSGLGKGDKVCRMKKALYGLKQAGRSWYKRLDEDLRTLGTVPSKGDPCVYTTRRSGLIMIIVIYVDDIFIMCEDADEITRFRDQLGKCFDLKDLGLLKRGLGMYFSRNNAGMSQKSYISELLQRFRMQDCNSVSTLLSIGVKLTKGEPWSQSDGERPPYRELMGSLLYLSVVATRPDISHAASLLSQYNDCFNATHWKAAKRVLRYLKHTSGLGILYKKKSDPLVGYVDANWGAPLDDRRSYTGYALVFSGGPVTWDLRKQPTALLSTTEAEYMALSDSAKEAIYLQRILLELGQDNVKVTTICNDNVGAQKLAMNPIFHGRTKHIALRHHYIREVVKSGQVQLSHIASQEMPADFLSKALTRPKHERCIRLLGITKRPSSFSSFVSRGSVKAVP